MTAAGDFLDGLGTVSSLADSYDVLRWINSASLVYRKKYFLNATATYSGSSRLGENNKWGLFPSVGGAILWNELPLFNSLKARASWGKSGNVPQSSNLSRSLLTAGGYSLQNGSYLPFYVTSRDANPDLQWEAKTEFNIGADFMLLNNRVSGSIDFFRNKVSHLISPVVIPSPPNLSNSMIANIGELKNRGLEINLNISAKRTTNFIWDVNLNLSHVKTKIVSLSAGGYTLVSDGSLNIGILPDAGGCSSHGVNLIREGEALGQIQGPVFKAVVDGTPTHQDLSGDGFYCDCPDDFTVLGNALPNFTLGVGNRIAYRNLEVGFFLRGALGHHKINSFRIYQEAVGSVSYSNLVETSYFDPALQYSHLSNRYVENAGFLRLENVTLRYNIPSPLKITISGTIQNLFTITKYTGLDPDIAYGSPVVPGQTTYPINQSPLVSGLDSRGNYLPARTFSLGIGLSL
jgi:iron complex outermembrane receptor protein